MKRKIAILGSTGSIGTQTLDVIRANKDKFSAEILVAGNNWELLAKQALEFEPNMVVLKDETNYPQLKEALKNIDTKVFCGEDSILDLMNSDCFDMIVQALVGYAGLMPTLKAIENKKAIALANKETLVAAGDLVMKLARENQVPILPIDSEHSAIFQSLIGEEHNTIQKILLTASGGPFREKSLEYMKTVTKAQALKHPNWVMGQKVTIDSASMMNKGLEAIEAMHLFDVDIDNIEILVHPQSIVHSGVEFVDGSVKVQMGMPDMRLPIQYAIGFPTRLKSDFKKLNLFDLQSLTFFKPNLDIFKNLKIAYQCAKKGGNLPCAMNAANEIAVKYFLMDKIGFLDMSELILNTLEKVDFIEKPSAQDYFATHQTATKIAEEIILQSK